MKKVICVLVLAAAGVNSGCLPLSPPDGAGQLAPQQLTPQQFTRPVRAEEVNEANARQQSEALREELERDARREQEPAR